MIPRSMSRTLRGLALAGLCAALFWFNRPEAAPVEASVGYEAGERLPAFTIEQTDGALFSLEECRGRVVVINLWATWYAPCVGELPNFDRLQAAHPDDVAVLAIHSSLITDDPVAYLADFDYGIAFAVDEDGAVIASLGGSTMLPQTAVLDRDGVVRYNKVGSLTYEALEELVSAAAR